MIRGKMIGEALNIIIGPNANPVIKVATQVWKKIIYQLAVKTGKIAIVEKIDKE